MVQMKAFAALVIVAFSVDFAAYEGHYRRQAGLAVNNAAFHVSNLNWRGFIGRHQG